jgi:hypothetical protein
MGGFRPLASSVPALANKALGRKGMAFAALLGDWPSVAGPEWSACMTPFRLSFPPQQRQDATLHVRLSGAAALAVQHAEPQILERINAWFGYRAVARLKLVHAPSPAQPRRKPARQPTPQEEEAIAVGVSGIDDPELRAALERLGRAVAGRRPAP